jgi:hypothetical protein
MEVDFERKRRQGLSRDAQRLIRWLFGAQLRLRHLSDEDPTSGSLGKWTLWGYDL